MTENLLYKLEEKVMVLLTEVEDLRQQVEQTKTENAFLKMEKEKYLTDRYNNERKLQDLLSLFEAVNAAPERPTLREEPIAA